MIVGVSGKSGSGKSSVCKYLQSKLGYTYLDVDDLVKEIRAKYVGEIIELVGNDKFIVNSEINSKLLGQMLFKDKQLMDKYNEYIYSKIKNELIKITKENNNLIIDTMFLPVMEIFKNCDYKVLLICNDDIRKERVITRDNIDYKYFRQRERYSIEYNYSDFDFIIDTSKIETDEINEIIEKIKEV